ncbi:MAG TPA: recombinase family protein [Actinocrinis sp.]|nr:recombinase family protein [Actinocrinis sp.]
MTATPMGGRVRGAVYCRLPHRRSADQAPLDRREQICRRAAADAGVPVSAREVFLDARADSWQWKRSDRAWSAMVAALRADRLTDVFVYGIRELADHAPADAAELLEAGRAHAVRLHDPCGDRDWNEPRARAELEAEVSRALQSIRDASATTRALQQDQVAAGLPHGGGRRAFGYAAGYRALMEAEAAVVREVFARFLAGESLGALAADLDARGVPCAAGGAWSSTRIARLLDAPRYAGLRIVRGQVARDADGNVLHGVWPACVSEQDWLLVQALRLDRQQVRAAQQRDRRDYLLTGLVECAGCVRSMPGTSIGGYQTYACPGRPDGDSARCARHIGARSLEFFVEERALRRLENWTPDASLSALLAHRVARTRITVRDAMALDGVTTGEDARDAWSTLTQARKTAALRFLFASIRIGPKTTARGVFDESRITPVPGPGPLP